MAALVDNSTKIANTTASTALETGAWTIAGSNRVLYVLVCSGAGAPVNPTACKWGGSGGTSLTQLGATLDIGGNWKASLWRLIAPTAQSSTVYAEWGSSQDERWLFCVSVKDVDQTTPNNTVAPATGASTTISAAATSVSGDLVLDFFAVGEQNPTLTADGSQTELQSLESGSGFPWCNGGTSYKSASSASTTMQWTQLAAASFGMFALAVNAAQEGEEGESFDPIPIPEPLPAAFGVYKRARARAG